MHILKPSEFPVIETEDFSSQDTKWELSFKTLDNFNFLPKTLMCMMCFSFRTLKYRPTERLAFNLFLWYFNTYIFLEMKGKSVRYWHLKFPNILQIKKSSEPIEISGFQKEKVFAEILQYYKSKGNKVYCGMNC